MVLLTGFATWTMSGLSVTAGLVFLLQWARAQDTNCDFTQNVVPGNVYYIYMPQSGSRYKPGVRCRWIGYCPSGYNCRIDCPAINLPQSASCSVDRLLISQTGDPQLASANYYCGQGSLSNVVSTAQTISMGLISSSNSPGGSFNCELRAQVVTSPPATCSCGYKKGNRIVGGSPTQPNEYTMMAGVIYNEQELIRCGATIISTTHVVTAGHCVATRNASSLTVVVGEHDVNSVSETTATQKFQVQKIDVHPQYVANNYLNDIAVLTIRGQIAMSQLVGPVCLPFRYTSTSFAGAKVEMLGWGSTEIGGPVSGVLRKVTVDIIGQSQCQSYIPNIASNQICTLTPGKDACQDDSGGPLLYWDSSVARYFLIGIVSYGRSCASGWPGINTRVSSHLDFIMSKAPNNYCRV